MWRRRLAVLGAVAAAFLLSFVLSSAVLSFVLSFAFAFANDVDIGVVVIAAVNILSFLASSSSSAGLPSSCVSSVASPLPSSYSVSVPSREARGCMQHQPPRTLRPYSRLACSRGRVGVRNVQGQMIHDTRARCIMPLRMIFLCCRRLRNWQLCCEIEYFTCFTGRD